jgi:hypothetical protein
MEQQTQCVNEDVTLLPLDQLAAIKPMGINACPFFRALSRFGCPGYRWWG